MHIVDNKLPFRELKTSCTSLLEKEQRGLECFPVLVGVTFLLFSLLRVSRLSPQRWEEPFSRASSPESGRHVSVCRTHCIMELLWMGVRQSARAALVTGFGISAWCWTRLFNPVVAWWYSLNGVESSFQVLLPLCLSASFWVTCNLLLFHYSLWSRSSRMAAGDVAVTMCYGDWNQICCFTLVCICLADKHFFTYVKQCLHQHSR